MILERGFLFPRFLFAHLFFGLGTVSLGAFSINMTYNNMKV